MKHIIIFVTSLLLASSINGQINVDSLKSELKKLGQLERESDIFAGNKIKYINNDSLVLYEVFQDSKGNITEELIGLAIYAYKYDDKKRLIEKRYYDKKGQLKFTDWPPIVMYTYDKKGNKVKVDYYGEDKKLVSRFEYDYDDQGRETEFRDINRDLEIDDITTYQYKDNGKVVITKMYDKDRKIITDRYGISMKYTEYLTNKRGKIVEERFLNSKGELVMINEFGSNIKFSVLKYIYGLKQNSVKIEYYDSNNKKVTESWRYDPEN